MTLASNNSDSSTLPGITSQTIALATQEAIRFCATHLRKDVLEAVIRSQTTETNERARQILSSIIENAQIASRDGVALCQDTGSVWLDLEVGPDVTIPGTIFSEVDAAVATAYAQGRLRYSIVKDALIDRTNTQTNAPAFCELHFRDKPGAELSVMLKGGGSDNASLLTMLPPSAGKDGILQTVVDWVAQKASNACPPLTIGIGIGGTFDTVAHLAKRALLRPVGTANAQKEIADFEQEILRQVNTLGIGPAALGGDTTALGVSIQTAPCHIAALPLAINMGCIALRSCCMTLQ